MKYALILAGGSGTRAGGALPKQFQKVGGRMMLEWSVESFLSYDCSIKIIVVLHPDFLSIQDRLQGFGSLKIDYVIGGKSRIESVKNGLDRIKSLISEKNEDERDSIVFIHDGARPLVTPQIIARGNEAVKANEGAVPIVEEVDSLRERVEGGETIPVDRSKFLRVQTPQVFIFRDIYDAYAKLGSEDGFTDDASVAENVGIKINTYSGTYENIKVTTPYDFIVADAILSARFQNVR